MTAEPTAAQAAHLPPPVRLANELSVQFPHLSSTAAAAAVAAHIRRFWDPRLRTALQGFFLSDEAALTPVARGAAQLLYDEK